MTVAAVACPMMPWAQMTGHAVPPPPPCRCRCPALLPAREICLSSGQGWGWMDGHRWPPFLWDHPPWGKDDQLLSGPSASVLRAIWSLTIIGRNHSSGFDRIWLINNSKLDFQAWSRQKFPLLLWLARDCESGVSPLMACSHCLPLRTSSSPGRGQLLPPHPQITGNALSSTPATVHSSSATIMGKLRNWVVELKWVGVRE